MTGHFRLANCMACRETRPSDTHNTKQGRGDWIEENATGIMINDTITAKDEGRDAVAFELSRESTVRQAFQGGKFM